jgi:hypothetical protein
MLACAVQQTRQIFKITQHVARLILLLLFFWKCMFGWKETKLDKKEGMNGGEG